VSQLSSANVMADMSSRQGAWIAWLSVVALGSAIAWMKLIPEGPRPTTTLELGAFAWIVLAVSVTLFLARRRAGWYLLVGIEGLFLLLMLFAGVIADIRAVGGLVLVALSFALLLTPAARSRSLSAASVQ
jgi:hypothetical protein